MLVRIVHLVPSTLHLNDFQLLMRTDTNTKVHIKNFIFLSLFPFTYFTHFIVVCSFKCHKKCSRKVPPSCGLPDDLLRVFKETIDKESRDGMYAYDFLYVLFHS